MEINNLEKQLHTLEVAIDKTLQHTNEVLSKAASKQELENLRNTYTSELQSMIEKYRMMQERIDKLDAASNKKQDFAFSRTELIQKHIFENEKFKKLLNGDLRSTTIELEKSTFELITKSVSISGRIPQYDIVLDMPVFKPDRSVHIRSFLSVGATNGDAISFTRESAIVDGTAMVAKAGTKPSSSVSLQEITRPVRKIATHIRVVTEMLNDIPYLSSYLSARFLKKLAVKEDEQILYGDNTGQNLDGIFLNAQFFSAPPASVVYLTDVFSIAKSIIAVNGNGEYNANAVMLHPEDYSTFLELTKDSDKRYILPNVFTGQQISVSNMPVYTSTAINKGDFLVGDFELGAQLFEREGATVKISFDDRDNPITNQVTFIFEKRVVLAVYRPDAFIKGTIASALANYSA